MFIQKKKNLKHKIFSPSGIAHIKTTSNNTIVTISDSSGNAICWASAGTPSLYGNTERLKNTKKGTPYAGQIAAKNAAQKAINLGVQSVGVIIKGTGQGRETAIRALKTTGLKIIYIEESTTIAHNGCRPRKKRKL